MLTFSFTAILHRRMHYWNTSVSEGRGGFRVRPRRTCTYIHNHIYIYASHSACRDSINDMGYSAMRQAPVYIAYRYRACLRMRARRAVSAMRQ